MSKYKVLFEYLRIITGVFLLAVALNVFFEPNGLVTGGVTGLGIIIAAVSVKLTGVNIPLWLTNIVLNLPLFIIGAKVLGFKFLRRTIISTAVLSIALFLTKYIPDIEGIDHPLASVFGGVLSGMGLGLVFRSSSTTGGGDLAATILHRYLKHISISKFMFTIDAVIILIGFFVFGPVSSMYAIIAVFISSKVIGAILEGLSFAKAAFIISDKYVEISDKLLSRIGRGATSLSGKGMYTKNDKNVLMCVVSEKEIIKLKDIVSEIDTSAFVIVTDVKEVLGEGFLSF